MTEHPAQEATCSTGSNTLVRKLRRSSACTRHSPSFLHQVPAIRISTMELPREAACWKAAPLPTILHSIQPDACSCVGSPLLSSVLPVLLLLRPPLCLPLFPLQGSSVFRWFLISSVFPVFILAAAVRYYPDGRLSCLLSSHHGF